MTTVAIEQAQADLAGLIEHLTTGEHVVITRNDVPVAELVPVLHPNPNPTYGSAKGMVDMSGDFDALLDDFQDYMQ